MKSLLLPCVVFALLSPVTLSAKKALLDKILGVFNDTTITHSQIKRIQQTLRARNDISPQIYKKSRYSKKELVELNVKQLLIRKELSNIGYIINDNQVESQIKATEKRIGTSRRELLEFLRNHNLTFEEYFEITRSTIEYNIFSSKVISPLISVTDQEIKNSFYKKNAKNKALDLKYTLIDFSINKKYLRKKMKIDFRNIIKKFQTTGVLPEKFSKIQTNVLGNITEEGLTKKLKTTLKKTAEGDATPPILIGDNYHVFWVKKKNVIESAFYRASKERIRRSLTKSAAAKIETDWFNQNKENHYIKYYL